MGMRAWFFSENAYHLLPDAREYDSIRVQLPNRHYDPKIGALNALLRWLGVIEHYQGWLAVPTYALGGLIVAHTWNEFALAAISPPISMSFRNIARSRTIFPYARMFAALGVSSTSRARYGKPPAASSWPFRCRCSLTVTASGG